MRVWVIWFFTLILHLFGAVSDAEGQCTVIQDEVETYLYTQGDFGQSFQVCATGTLSQMDFMVHHFLNGSIDATLTIFQGEGYDGSTLYSAPLTLTDEWGSIHSHTLSEEVLCMLGQVYTFRIEFFGEYGLMWAKFQDTYADGQVYWDGTPYENIDIGFNAHILYPEEPPCITWTGAVDSDWDEPANWLPQIVPDSTDCVFVPANDSGTYPAVDVPARAGSLNIHPEAGFHLQSEGELAIYGSLQSANDCTFDGTVVLHSLDGNSEINGSPTFDHLKIIGVFFTTEPIEILNVLDLSEGYLANLGTELILNSGEGYYGHAYIPQDLIVGSVIIKKHIDHAGEQILGIPFVLDEEVLINGGQGLEDLMLFEQEFCMEGFHNNWQPLDQYEPNGPCDALRSFVIQEHIELAGATTNEEMIVHGQNNEAFDLGRLQLISNPYPSVIDLDDISISPGASQATYRWLPEKQQFGSRNGGWSTHDMGDMVLPSDAFIVQLAEAHHLKFIYSEIVPAPWDLMQPEQSTVSAEHQIKLSVTAPGGSDETILRFTGASTLDFDPSLDALKIPSLNEFTPALGSASASGEVLSINALPHPPVGASVPLYFSSDLEGEIGFDPVLIDVGQVYDQIFLYDALNETFHDLMTEGLYHTVYDPNDGEDRFLLIFGIDDTPWYHPDSEQISDGGDMEEGPPAEELGPTDGSQTTADWNIGAVLDELIIRPTPNSEGEGRIQVTIHSLRGRLVFDRQVDLDSSGWKYRLQLSPGMYSISIRQGDKLHSEKIWLDRS
ncbi:MAG: T9SS type A sorting domain-containing protein [Flavobacteriales bacterium]|nr:T9SS type A sorting domain-containing protein [Flavobacteriales bacterium]